MTRALMLLIVVAAASSAAVELSPCKLALKPAHENFANVESCKLQYKTELDKFISNTKCTHLPYDVATCDPLLYNYSKCALKFIGVLKPDNTVDDVAFQKILLQNKCSKDTNFAKAYPTCKSSTMKYLNVVQFIECLDKAVP
ncbi:uncharacterized protein LOC125179252 [Hyalella azteca]|uniref:Uncharacterized protein LOC125179252 n=1 Tax=Hyalella azteca TaxID=294128 RepID=A0A979FU31_HYAAZ|nr:uncharacterized protein LOC125179252 [Hyalella azteca]